MLTGAAVSEASHREPSMILSRDSGFAWTLVASVLLHLVFLAAGLVLYPAISSRVRHQPRIAYFQLSVTIFRIRLGQLMA